MIVQVLFLEISLFSSMQQKPLMYTSHFFTKIVEKTCSHESRFKKITWSETGFSPSLQMCGIKEQNDYWDDLVPLLWFVLNASSFTHHCFCVIKKNIRTVVLEKNMKLKKALKILPPFVFFHGQFEKLTIFGF